MIFLLIGLSITDREMLKFPATHVDLSLWKGLKNEKKNKIFYIFSDIYHFQCFSFFCVDPSFPLGIFLLFKEVFLKKYFLCL